MCRLNCTISAKVNVVAEKMKIIVTKCEKYKCTQKAETQTPTCAEWISRFRQDVKNRCREMDFTKNIEQLKDDATQNLPKTSKDHEIRPDEKEKCKMDCTISSKMKCRNKIH